MRVDQEQPAAPRTMASRDCKRRSVTAFLCSCVHDGPPYFVVRRKGFRRIRSTQVAVVPTLRPDSRLSRELRDDLYSVNLANNR
eukprot:3100018-Amphidinium_carterae.1